MAPSSEWRWHFYNYMFWIGDHFLKSFQPTSLHCYFTFLLINDVRMTTFTHQLLSRKTSTPEVWQCECEYSSRSATCPSTCCARAMHKSFSFIQPDGKLDTMWRDAWQRLASSYPTSRWDVAVNIMVTAAERCSLSHRQKHRNLQREKLQFTLSTE